MKNKNISKWLNPEIINSYLSGNKLGFPGAQDHFDLLIRLIKNNNNQVNNFLDIGCGDGLIGSIILNKFQNSKGIFLDFSSEMLINAKNKLSIFSSRYELINSDISDAKWIENIKNYTPFDVIVSGLTIHHQSNNRKQEIYREIFDLLNLNGIFINIEHVKPSSKWIEKLNGEIFIDNIYDFFNDNNKNITKDDVINELKKQSHKELNVLETVDIQCSWLEKIGFKDVDCYHKIFELAIFGGRKY
jgi:tRNA (cmo5U34)-methyltransferase